MASHPNRQPAGNSSAAALLFLLSVPGCFAFAGEGDKDPTFRKDKLGDPLPRGAAGRLGSSRWRLPGPVTVLAFIDGGKHLLASCGDGVVHILDVSTGEEVRAFGQSQTVAHNDHYCLWPPGWYWSSPFEATCVETVSADAAKLGQLGADQKLHVWDVATGKEIISIPHEFKSKARGLKFLRDGSGLLAWGDQHTMRIWDLDGDAKPRVLLDDRVVPPRLNEDRPAKIFHCNESPNGIGLLTMDWLDGHPGEMAVALWDLKQGKQTRVIAVPKKEGWMEDDRYTVFSPDGKSFAWPAPDGRIQLFDAATLKELTKLGPTARESLVRNMSFSPNGKILAVVNQNHRIRLLDVSTGEALSDFGDQLPGPLRDDAPTPLCWSRDGKLLAQGWGEGIIRVWNTKSGKGNESPSGHRRAITGMILSDDGKSILTVAMDRTVRNWDLVRETEECTISLPKTMDFAFLLDATRLLLAEHGSFSIWNLKSAKRDECVAPIGKHEYFYQVVQNGKAVCVLEKPVLFAGAGYPHVRWFGIDPVGESARLQDGWTKKREPAEGSNAQPEEQLVAVVPGPEGAGVAATVAVRQEGLRVRGDRTVADPDAFCIRYKRAIDGKDWIWSTKETACECRAVGFTPDGRCIVTFNRGKTNYVTLLEAATGNERCRFEVAPVVFAFSNSGDLLALGASDGTTTLVDVHRGKEVARLNGGQGPIGAIAFASGSASLLTAGADGTILIWTLSEPLDKVRTEVEVDKCDAKRLWITLADPKTTRAYEAASALVSAPTRAIALLSETLHPTKKASTSEIAKLIADLDNDDFDTRQSAFAELERVGPQAKPAVQKALEDTHSLDFRKRARELLAILSQRESIPGDSELRELRGVEVLEAIGTPEARKILESLARGADKSRLTDAAAAAIRRLTKSN